MSKYPDITPIEVGNFYGLRTWVEYGLKQSKNELGWGDYRSNPCEAMGTDFIEVGIVLFLNNSIYNDI
jgi:hypothetical protein